MNWTTVKDVGSCSDLHVCWALHYETCTISASAAESGENDLSAYSWFLTEPEKSLLGITDSLKAAERFPASRKKVGLAG